MELNVFKIEAMFSIRLRQRFLIFVILPDYGDNEITFCPDT